MRIGETEKHFVQLYISTVVGEDVYLVLFKEIGEEFLGIPTENTDILIPLPISFLGALCTESRDLLVYEFGDLYPNLHSQNQLFREQWR